MIVLTGVEIAGSGMFYDSEKESSRHDICRSSNSLDVSIAEGPQTRRNRAAKDDILKHNMEGKQSHIGLQSV